MENARIVYVTTPDMDTAEKIGKHIIERRLAACVSMVPGLRSIYRWEDKLCDETEVLMVIKTSVQRLHELEEAVTELHPYQVPEIIAVPVFLANKPYLDWIMQETR